MDNTFKGNQEPLKYNIEGKDIYGNSVQTTKDDEPTLIDIVSGSSTYYVGWAIPNSSENDSVWKIKKIFKDGDVWKQFYANGNENYVNIWSNRENLNYI